MRAALIASSEGRRWLKLSATAVRGPRLRTSRGAAGLHEGRSVIYVARQLAHDARLTLTRYGQVIDELEDMPQIEAEAAIANARSACSDADGAA